jgi:uncharacterized membrane-anchored protein
MRAVTTYIKLVRTLVGLSLLAGTVAPITMAAATAATTGVSQPSPEQFAAAMSALKAALNPQKGKIEIGEAPVSLDLGDKYYFLPADQAKRVLTEAWGNPPTAVQDVLGMVFPTGKNFDDDTWAAVVTFKETGYVSDADAKDIDYAELLASMQSDAAEASAADRAAGYPGSTLVGWAQPPTYDAKTHALVWAQNLKFDGSPGNTLNYDIRILGRTGVLSLNIVAGMDDLQTVRAAAKTFASVGQFDAGARYADFNEATDAKAEYGLAGLVAAGAGAAAAKKLGLLAVLAKFWKIIALGVVGAFAAFMKFFRRKPDEDELG